MFFFKNLSFRKLPDIQHIRSYNCVTSYVTTVNNLDCVNYETFVLHMFAQESGNNT